MMFRRRSLVGTLGAMLLLSPISLVNVPATGAVNSAAASCSKRNTQPFVPVAISVKEIGRIQVKGLNAHPNGVPKTLPLTNAGKTKIAWDRPGFRPAAATGHVLMSAHVWPDGTSIGNQLNEQLKRGKIVKVLGAAGEVQCYRLSKRVVKAPSRRLANKFYGDIHSKHRLTILTCTGVRRGPGDWSLRSIWFAKPVK
jgi:hypothetical protein